MISLLLTIFTIAKTNAAEYVLYNDPIFVWTLNIAAWGFYWHLITSSEEFTGYISQLEAFGTNTTTYFIPEARVILSWISWYPTPLTSAADFVTYTWYWSWLEAIFPTPVPIDWINPVFLWVRNIDIVTRGADRRQIGITLFVSPFFYWWGNSLNGVVFKKVVISGEIAPLPVNPVKIYINNNLFMTLTQKYINFDWLFAQSLSGEDIKLENRVFRWAS